MFIYIGSNKKVKTACKLANEIVLHSAEFKEHIINKDSYDMTEPSDLKADIVHQSMCNLLYERDVIVKVYYPWYRFSKALGYFSKDRPFDINLNGYKLKRSTGSIVSTLVHELVHMCDNLDNDHYYGHGDNSKKGKENTMPYYIGYAAGRYLDVNIDKAENYTYKKKTSLFTKFKKLFI